MFVRTKKVKKFNVKHYEYLKMLSFSYLFSYFVDGSDADERLSKEIGDIQWRATSSSIATSCKMVERKSFRLNLIRLQF